MNKHFAILERLEENALQTIGVITFFKDDQVLLTLRTLELGWHDNEPNKSCIPKGIYVVSPYSSKKYPKAYEVQDVPNRSYILFHQGNFYTDIRGCILVGKAVADINKDGQLDVVNSTIALTELVSLIGDNEFDLHIV